jgi:hypothetical protein
VQEEINGRQGPSPLALKRQNMFIALPISAGELVDKLTILDIKSKRIRNKDKAKQATTERNLLESQYKKIMLNEDIASFIAGYRKELRRINSRLWKVEEMIREYDRRKDFGRTFIKLARSVYRLNDERFEIKEQINRLTGSFISEVKDYSKR